MYREVRGGHVELAGRWGGQPRGEGRPEEQVDQRRGQEMGDTQLSLLAWSHGALRGGWEVRWWTGKAGSSPGGCERACALGCLAEGKGSSVGWVSLRVCRSNLVW